MTKTMMVTTSRTPASESRKPAERQSVQKEECASEEERQSLVVGKGRHEEVRELQARCRP
jgi:hypothetical protein